MQMLKSCMNLEVARRVTSLRILLQKPKTPIISPCNKSTSREFGLNQGTCIHSQHSIVHRTALTAHLQGTTYYPGSWRQSFANCQLGTYCAAHGSVTTPLQLQQAQRLQRLLGSLPLRKALLPVRAAAQHPPVEQHLHSHVLALQAGSRQRGSRCQRGASVRCRRAVAGGLKKGSKPGLDTALLAAAQGKGRDGPAAQVALPFTACFLCSCSSAAP